MVYSSNAMKVLSIQSHVVHGYVGNRSSVLPLQILGIEVDYINSVQFSNHTAYPTFKGQCLTANDLREIYSGLKFNGLNKYSHILTGYVGRADFLEAVVDIIKDIKNTCPNVKYYCDPVLGDSGQMYVPADLVPVYRDKVLPLADVILPNQFEAELLTSRKIVDEPSALSCIRALHSRFRVSTVILSSSNIRLSAQSVLYPDDVMFGYASRLCQNESDCGDSETNGCSPYHSDVESYEQVRLVIPRLDAEFRGTGDLFSALTLARLENCSNLQDCFQLVLSSINAILRRTLASAVSDRSAGLSPFAHLELKLVQSIDDIRDPPKTGNYVQMIAKN